MGAFGNLPAELPADPGGPLTPERLRILRVRAQERMDGVMVDVLNALEDEQAKHRETALEAAVLLRVMRNGVAWLDRLIETGEGDVRQHQRALVLSGVIPCELPAAAALVQPRRRAGRLRRGYPRRSAPRAHGARRDGLAIHQRRRAPGGLMLDETTRRILAEDEAAEKAGRVHAPPDGTDPGAKTLCRRGSGIITGYVDCPACLSRLSLRGT